MKDQATEMSKVAGVSREVETGQWVGRSSARERAVAPRGEPSMLLLVN